MFPRDRRRGQHDCAFRTASQGIREGSEMNGTRTMTIFDSKEMAFTFNRFHIQSQKRATVGLFVPNRIPRVDNLNLNVDMSIHKITHLVIPV